MFKPRQYPQYNTIASIESPSTVHSRNTFMTEYFRRYLYNDFRAAFEWTLPEHWAQNYFEAVLYCYGYIAVINTDKFGIIPQQCSISGYNVMYQPTNVYISNPLLKGVKNPYIGRGCSIIKILPDYGGVADLIGYYADLMSITAEAIAVNIFNTRLAYIFFAKNKASAESYKKMYDDIAAGNPISVVDKDLYTIDGQPSWMMFNQDVKSTYVAGDMLDDLRKIRREFLTKIGIPNSGTEKNERLIKDEVNFNNAETECLIDVMLKELNKGLKQTKDLFGIDISVRKKFNIKLKEQNGGDKNVVDNRT